MAREVTLATGLRVAFDDDSEGVPLIALHGAESGRRQFADLQPSLEPRIRVISADQRDTAGVRGGDVRYGMSDLADDAAFLLDALELESAHVVGTSFGGALAQHLALRHPSRVRSLVLIATTADRRSVQPYVERMAKLRSDERAAAALDGALSPAGRNDPDLVERVRSALVARTAERHARRMAALAGHDTIDQVHLIAAPTLVIHGEADPVIPVEEGRRLAQLIPGARLEVVAGARHAVAFEHRDRVGQLLSQFVLQQEDARVVAE